MYAASPRRTATPAAIRAKGAKRGAAQEAADAAYAAKLQAEFDAEPAARRGVAPRSPLVSLRRLGKAKR